ncbi:MAG TPA: superoxide dismutase [Candidatus Dormibacteraeota bacterium]|jgi:Fe-Mn family superoxide dismutase|nr:superoxide dismutase [Candidatus Dormibacteraeota bacterium]
MAFELPPLPYPTNALEPYIDALTMEIHHDRHHGTYVSNLNAAIEKHPELAGKTVEDLLGNLGAVPEDIRTAVRNNGGGHLNHSIFWTIMKPGGGGEPVGDFARAVNEAFGSFAAFKDTLSKTAVGQFGSGWGWAYLDGSGKLTVKGFPNQDNPVMEGGKPIVGVDVWEHAYYLKYQNRRADYVAAWWNTVDWEEVDRRYRAAR